MNEMFNRRVPHTLITLPNIIFEHEMRRLRWPRSAEDLGLFSKNSFVIIHALIWGLIICGLPTQVRSDLMAAIFVFLANLGISFAADAYYMAVTLGQTDRAAITAEWDMLRMTPLRPSDILAAKLAAAEIRGWRLMALETAVRAIAVEFIALAAFVMLFLSLFKPPLFAALGPVVALSIGLVLEPLWRMRTLVALSVAIGVEVQNTTNAFLTGIAVVIGMLLLRLLVFALLFGSILGAFLAATSLYPAFQNFYCLSAPLLAAGLLILMHGFYFRLERWAVRHTAARIEHGD